MTVSDDLAGGAHRVCPRCGTAAGQSTWCSRCGLNLPLQPELPTADAFSAQAREKRWLEGQARRQIDTAESPAERHEGGIASAVRGGNPRPRARRLWLIGAAVLVVLAVGSLAALTFAGAFESDAEPDPQSPKADANAAEEASSRVSREAVGLVAHAFGASEGEGGCRYLSASALAKLGGDSGCRSEFEGIPAAEFDVQEVAVEGETASASVQNVESDMVIELEFIKQGDEWKISSFPGLDEVD